MRTVFLGTSAFAATVLRRIAASPHRPRLVVAPPDRPRGRGRKLAPPPAVKAARELRIDVLQVSSVNEAEAVEGILASVPELGVVCAFGQLIGVELLERLEMLNVHPSLLPRWRGAAPIERAIMARDAITGVSVMRVTEGLDSGPVALRAETPIGPAESFGALEPRLAAIGGDLVVQGLDLRAAGELELTDQDEGLASYAEKIRPEDRRLDPSRPAADLAAQVRALTPHIGTHLELEDGGWLGVLAATAGPGTVEAGGIKVQDDALVLGCVEGVLRLEMVQPPGGRPMPADAYIRGHNPPARAT